MLAKGFGTAVARWALGQSRSMSPVPTRWICVQPRFAAPLLITTESGALEFTMMLPVTTRLLLPRSSMSIALPELKSSILGYGNGLPGSPVPAYERRTPDSEYV